jgi:hypothetical protein
MGDEGRGVIRSSDDLTRPLGTRPPISGSETARDYPDNSTWAEDDCRDADGAGERGARDR